MVAVDEGGAGDDGLIVDAPPEERRGEAFYGAVQPAPVLYDGRGPRLKAQLPAYLPSLDR